jgi:hypothetical protein
VSIIKGIEETKNVSISIEEDVTLPRVELKEDKYEDENMDAENDTTSINLSIPESALPKEKDVTITNSLKEVETPSPTKQMSQDLEELSIIDSTKEMDIETKSGPFWTYSPINETHDPVELNEPQACNPPVLDSEDILNEEEREEVESRGLDEYQLEEDTRAEESFSEEEAQLPDSAHDLDDSKEVEKESLIWTIDTAGDVIAEEDIPIYNVHENMEETNEIIVFEGRNKKLHKDAFISLEAKPAVGSQEEFAPRKRKKKKKKKGKRAPGSSVFFGKLILKCTPLQSTLLIRTQTLTIRMTRMLWLIICK